MREALRVAFACCGLLPALPSSAMPPDVVVFLADDLGFSDLPAYGGEIRAPALDALAAVRPHRGEWALYDLAADRTELHDLAAARPDELARLVAAWEAWAETAGVQPWPWVLPLARYAAAVLGLAALLLLAAVAWAAHRAVRRRRGPA